MALLQVNGEIVRVRAPGATPDYRHAEGTGGTAVWEGAVGVYVKERRERVVAGGATSIEVHRSLIVANDEPPVEYAADQIVEYTFRGQPEAGTIDAVERAELVGMAPVATTRVHLRNT